MKVWIKLHTNAHQAKTWLRSWFKLIILTSCLLNSSLHWGSSVPKKISFQEAVSKLIFWVKTCSIDHMRCTMANFGTSNDPKHQTYKAQPFGMQIVQKIHENHFNYLELWSSQGPQKPILGPNFHLKMTGKGWNWPKCTSCDLSYMFSPQKINIETVCWKLVFLVRNCPLVGNL